jgi:hypothetical protein
MRALNKRTSGVVALVAGGVLLLGAPAVYADNITSGEEGDTSGNQVITQLNAPDTSCGNGAVDSEVECDQEVEAGGTGGDNVTSGEEGTASGNQEIIQTNTPTTTCGDLAEGSEVQCEQEVESGDGGGGSNITSGE